MKNIKECISMVIMLAIIAFGLYIWKTDKMEYIPYLFAAIVLVLSEANNIRTKIIIYTLVLIGAAIYTIYNYNLLHLISDEKLVFVIASLLGLGVIGAIVSILLDIINYSRCTCTIRAKHTCKYMYKKNFNGTLYKKENDGGQFEYVETAVHEYEYVYSNTTYHIKHSGSSSEKNVKGSPDWNGNIPSYDVPDYVDIKINPKKPKEYRLKSTNFEYKFALIVCLSDITLMVIILKLIASKIL